MPRAEYAQRPISRCWPLYRVGMTAKPASNSYGDNATGVKALVAAIERELTRRGPLRPWAPLARLDAPRRQTPPSGRSGHPARAATFGAVAHQPVGSSRGPTAGGPAPVITGSSAWPASWPSSPPLVERVDTPHHTLGEHFDACRARSTAPAPTVSRLAMN